MDIRPKHGKVLIHRSAKKIMIFLNNFETHVNFLIIKQNSKPIKLGDKFYYVKIKTFLIAKVTKSHFVTKVTVTKMTTLWRRVGICNQHH